MAERAKITWKGENPPRKLQTQKEEVFNAADLRRMANQSLDDLKKELYAQGVSPSAVSAQWQQARLLHDKFLKNIDEYQSEGDADAKIALEKNLKESLSNLRGDVSDSVLDGRSDVLLSRTKDNSRRKFKKNSLDKFEKVFGNAMHEQTKEYLLPLQERQVAIRARLAELEAAEASNAGLKQNREPEVLALEQELRGVEIKIKEGKRIGNESTKSQTQPAPGLEEGHDSAPDPVDAEHEVENDAVPPEEESPRFNDGIRDAEFEDSVSASRELVPLPSDATHGEVKARLRTLREKLAGLSPKEGDPKLPTLSPKELYELRVETMASKHGMQDMFERVRVVREEYLEARALAHQRGYAQDNIGDLKKTYDNTLFYWRNDLTRKAESLTGKERAELLIAAKRDTILGPAQVEIEARERALTEKGKTALGKAEIWLTQTPQLALKGLNFIPNAIGSGIAHAFRSDSLNPNKAKTYLDYQKLANLSPEERKLRNAMIEQDYARKYARNVRILAGAGVATFLAVSATPVSLGSGALAFAVYTARGALGTAAGVGGAKAAGWGFNFFNKNKRQELKDWTSKVPSTLEEYQAQQAAYIRGNSRKRSQEKMGWQMVAAMVTGAGVGAVSSPLAHEFLEHIGALPSVKEAAQSVAEVNAHSPGAGAEAMKLSAALKHSAENSHLNGGHLDAQQAAPEHLASSGHIATPHAVGSERIPTQVTEPYFVEIKPGEGMDKLFVELREHYGKLYPDPSDSSVPPGIKHLLEAKSGDELSRELHFINSDNASYVMKQGDSLGFNEHGALIFTPKGDPTHSLELFTTDSKGTFTPHVLTPEEQQGHFLSHPDGVRSAPIHHETPRVPESQTPVAHPETPDEVTARLNTEGRMGHPIAPSEAPVSTDAPVNQDDIANTGDSPVHHDVPEAVPAPEQAHAAEAVPDTRQAPSDVQSSAPSAKVEQPTPPTTEPAVPQESVSSIEHPFAVLGATPDLNPHGVDLNQPQILLNEGRWFAHGTDNSDSYERAVAFSQELSKTTNDSNVYFVTKEYDVFGREYLAVRMVFTPPGGGVSQMAPYAEGLNPSAQFVMPPLPKDADYQLPPK